ncbi:MAG: hypothetical protein LPK92_03610, partial [Actinomycetes bacterium]|nr:hypothetical protein [Actinomycetes bacterium]
RRSVAVLDRAVSALDPELGRKRHETVEEWVSGLGAVFGDGPLFAWFRDTYTQARFGRAAPSLETYLEFSALFGSLLARVGRAE